MGLTHRQPPIAESTVQQVASLGFDFREQLHQKIVLAFRQNTPRSIFKAFYLSATTTKKLISLSHFYL